jgi:NADH-quinone oxidoreductase subunit N
MAAEVKKSGRVFQLGTQYMSDAAWPQAKKLIADGLIIVGDVSLPLGASSRRTFIVVLALLGVGASIGMSGVLIAADEKGEAFDGLMRVDDYALFFNFLFAGIAGIIVLASVDYLQRNRFQAEYNALVLVSTVGMMLMASTLDLIAIFVALELQSISLYILVAFVKDGRGSEAALKYLVLGAVSTAMTLYGMAYLFGLSGSTSLDDIATFVRTADSGARSALGEAFAARTTSRHRRAWTSCPGRSSPRPGSPCLPPDRCCSARCSPARRAGCPAPP